MLIKCILIGGIIEESGSIRVVAKRHDTHLGNSWRQVFWPIDWAVLSPVDEFFHISNRWL